MQDKRLEELQKEMERRRREQIVAVVEDAPEKPDQGITGDGSEPTPGEKIFSLMYTVLSELRALKSPDRTARDRHIAVCTTEAEKLIAYFEMWVLNNFEG